MDKEKEIIAGRYEIGPAIGAGTTGTVYRGHDLQSKEPVAIKVLHTDILLNAPELLERFRREGEALRRLEHPNIVKVISTVEENGQHYLIMEYVAGGSLATKLQQQTTLPVDQTIALSLELADALTRAHHLNILHRDIKPGNILLSEDGTPRLTDFGLARLSNSPSITTTGSMIGTPYYLSPEACYQQDVDERTDIWSFGVVIFEMITGRRPFVGDTMFDVAYAIKNLPIPEWALQREDIPPSLAELISGMLRKDRPARIGSARQVGVELEKIQKWLQKPENLRTPLPQNANRQNLDKIRVLIVDDHAVVRQGLRTFIDLQEDMTVVAEGGDGLEGVDLATRLQPDIVLLDLVMPNMDGIEATRQIHECSPNSKILILTSFGEDDKVFPAIRNGALGYLLKDIHPNDLVKAVRSANQGQVQLHPDIAKKLMDSVSSQVKSAPVIAPVKKNAMAEIDLTDREKEVLSCIARGLNNREIAREMVISEKTVKTHVSNLLSKLAVDDRTQAAIWAIKNELGS